MGKTFEVGIASRNGYASCHDGLKHYSMKNEKKFVLAAFGLSGSGKSTITHAAHDGKYDITVLHDDAFVVNVRDKYGIWATRLPECRDTPRSWLRPPAKTGWRRPEGVAHVSRECVAPWPGSI